MTFTFGLNENNRIYDFLLYNSLTYEDRLEFDLNNIREAYKVQRPGVDQKELETKLKEYKEFAMKNYENAQKKKKEEEKEKSNKCKGTK